MKKIVVFAVVLVILATALWVFVSNILNCKMDVQIIEAYSVPYVELPEEMLESDFHMSSSQSKNDYDCFRIKLKVANNNAFDVCNWRLTSVKIDKDITFYFDHSTPEAACSVIEVGSERELTYLVYAKISNISEDEVIETFENADIKARAQKVIKHSTD